MARGLIFLHTARRGDVLDYVSAVDPFAPLLRHLWAQGSSGQHAPGDRVRGWTADPCLRPLPGPTGLGLPEPQVPPGAGGPAVPGERPRVLRALRPGGWRANVL